MIYRSMLVAGMLLALLEAPARAQVTVGDLPIFSSPSGTLADSGFRYQLAHRPAL
jgi:hypothetical protein